MKKLNKIWGTGLLALLLFLAAPSLSSAQGGEYISDQQFYDDLEPYGTWVTNPRYGDVWIPDAEEGFRPYATRGHWVLTDYGNTWVSDYPWGWATFHYGRWYYDDYYGWEWIPGNEWAPAWVNWRYGGGYYGWAPLSPGITVSIAIGGGYHVPDYYWVCAPQAYINRPNIYNYYVPHSRVVNIINRTTIINNTYVYNNQRYIAGPRREDIRRSTRQNVRVYRINDQRRPGSVRVSNNAVNIYRPAVNRSEGSRPKRVIDGEAYKREHPHQPIAHHNSKGAPANNHTNAARLAHTARTARPGSNVVRVNSSVNHRQPANRPTPTDRRSQQVRQRQQQDQQRRQQQAQQRQQQDQQRRQQQAQQRQQQDQQRRQQQAQQRQQQDQQRRQQQAQQHQPQEHRQAPQHPGHH